MQSITFVGIKLPGEIITVNNSKHSPVNVQIVSQIEVLPGEVLWRGDVRFGDFMSFEEDSLRDAGVLNSGFNDVQSVVFQIVVDNALADSEVFVFVFNNSLLEVGIELQDLFMNKV